MKIILSPMYVSYYGVQLIQCCISINLNKPRKIDDKKWNFKKLTIFKIKESF